MAKIDLKIQGEKKDIEHLLKAIGDIAGITVEAASEVTATNVSFARLEMEELEQ